MPKAGAVNAQTDALGLTNPLSTGVQANKAGKLEISTSRSTRK